MRIPNKRVIRIEPYGALIHTTNPPVTIRLNRQEARALLRYRGPFPRDLTAPEVVHLEISNRCNMNCRECYVREKTGAELTTEQWKRIIADLAENNVLQCTFGGGEPFMRDDIFELASYVRQLGMNLAVTTNGTLLRGRGELSLFDQINFSVHGDNLDALRRKIKTAARYTKVGINFVLSKFNARHLTHVARYCRDENVELLLLTYKPVIGDVGNVVKPSDVMWCAQSLARLGVPVAVDGLACGMCYAARRFVDVDSVGNVYPCSFIRVPLGNLLRTSLKNIWRRRRVPSSCPYGGDCNENKRWR